MEELLMSTKKEIQEEKMKTEPELFESSKKPMPSIWYT